MSEIKKIAQKTIWSDGVQYIRFDEHERRISMCELYYYEKLNDSVTKVTKLRKDIEIY